MSDKPNKTGKNVSKHSNPEQDALDRENAKMRKKHRAGRGHQTYVGLNILELARLDRAQAHIDRQADALADVLEKHMCSPSKVANALIQDAFDRLVESFQSVKGHEIRDSKHRSRIDFALAVALEAFPSPDDKVARWFTRKVKDTYYRQVRANAATQSFQSASAG